MRHIADHFTATLDANVLYPFLVRDVLLSFADVGLFRPIWSADIQCEWSSHLIADKPDKETAILRTVEVMNDAFPEALIDGHEDLIPGLRLPDANDRHVLAAAIRSGSSVIVTENIADFPPAILDLYEIEALTADNFVANVFDLYPTEAIAALRIMRQRYMSPSMTGEELLVALAAAKLVALAGELKLHLASL
jgi:hypothetical protein